MTSVVVKRPSESNGSDSALVKRHKADHELSAVLQPSRTSSLPAPTMLLAGHGAAINVNRFNRDGSILASGSFDRQIYLWRITNDCENFMALKGHQGSVLELSWAPDDKRLYSVASDKVITIWDAEVGYQIKKLRNHRSFVNTCTASRSDPNLFCTGSDDGSVLFWDARSKDPQAQLDLGLPVTSVALANDDLTVFVGGVDSAVTGWDLRNASRTYVLDGAQDMATGLSLSPDGAFLLVNSMDNALRCFDVRPYCPGSRFVKQFFGATHDFEKNLLRCAWSPDGSKVTAGSADRLVHIWDVDSGRILYKLPGHKGSVNDVAFHPVEPIVASASSDETIYLGELN